MALFEAFCAFFWPPFPEALFSWLWSAVLWQHSRWGGHTRNATKQGVSEPFRVSVPLRSLLACRNGFILRTPLEDNFFRRLLFCTVPCSKFCRNWVSKLKKPLGLQNRARFEKRIFRSVSAARANLARGGCAAVPFFSVDFGSLSKMALPLRCGGFFRLFRFFFSTPFSKTSSGPLHIPVFFFGCFSLLFAFFLGLGATPHCTYVFGQLAFNPSYFLGVFGVFLEKHCFSPWKRVIWVHFSVSPFCVSLSFFLASFTSLCHSLSLSLLSLFFFILSCFFSSLLSCLYFYLPCFFAVLSCLVASFLFHEKNNIKILHLKVYFHNLCLFIFLFRLSNMFLSLFFHYLSCLCWWTSMFFNFSKKTISKTPILVLHIVKGYRFL